MSDGRQTQRRRSSHSKSGVMPRPVIEPENRRQASDDAPEDDPQNNLAKTGQMPPIDELEDQTAVGDQDTVDGV